MKRAELVAFLAVMVIAVFMRLYGLSWAPPGLSTDEASGGNAAISAIHSGQYRLFYPEQNGREGLFVNIEALSIRLLGNTSTALRLVSVLVGVLTVLGTYLLARRLFDDWRVASMAAFLMATGFWHVNFSRIGLPAIMAPLMAVWGFYYLYKGIETHRLWDWALAGLWFGLGFHAYVSFRVIPGAVALALIAYWLSLRAVFSHGKYEHARHQMLGGAAMMVAVMILVLLPIVAHFYANPQVLVGPTLRDVGAHVAGVFGMFFFRGDTDWHNNIAGSPILFWPVAALFAVGLFHTIWRLFHSWRQRGHPGIVQTLLVSWFFVGLVPAVISTGDSPDALRALVVAPAVYLMAAVGLHWLFVWLERWYGKSDYGQICLPLKHLPGSWGHRVCVDRSTFVVTVALLTFLLAVGVADARRYFVDWAGAPAVSDAFDARYSDFAVRLLSLPPAALKYVVASRGTELVHGIPISAQAVMYLTDTAGPEQQRATNIYYLTQQQFDQKKYPRGAVVVQLDP